METQTEEKGAPTPGSGTRLSAEEIHENVLVQAKDEMERPASDLFWSAITAGLTIGWSFVGGAYVSTLVGPEYRRAAQAALYPLGFIFVIIGRSQLFTENTLEPVIPVLDEPTGEKVGKMLRLWGLVLLGNMIGAAAFALLFAHTNVVHAEVVDQMREMSTKALEGTFGSQFYHAIFAGWLIALTAWLVAATTFTGAQIALIWLTTAPIAALEFRHSIAGSVEAFYAASSGLTSWALALGGFTVPTVLGNIVGGVIFVAMLDHGQVSGKRS
ncbi:MAG: formate/nitrite transporter family protein [Gemmatimonadota bacterium]